MSAARLDESNEWTGYWWRPDAPDDVVAGVLRYSPGKGGELVLIGHWSMSGQVGSVRDGATSDEPFRWPAILGKSGSSLLTLVEPWVESTRGPFGEPPVETTLRCMTLLDGCHIESPDTPSFVGARVTVENLTGWAERGHSEIDLYRAKSPTDSEDSARRSATARLEHVEATLHTWSDSRSSRLSRDARTISRSSEASVSFASADERTMENWFSMASAISDLLSLSTMSACAQTTLTLLLPPEPENFPPTHPLREYPRSVDVYQRQVVQPDREGKAAIWSDFVVTEADRPWSELLPAWIEVRERFSAARSMILGLRYVTSGYLDTRVVTAVGAAEAFHRALEVSPPIPPDEFEAMRKTLFAAVPQSRRSWLNDRIQWNEPTLKQRLLDLARRPGPFMSALVPDTDTWARSAARARNDLAHRGTPTDQDYERLHAVVQVTSAVVTLNLLKEMGLSAARLQHALTTHPDLTWACELAQKHFVKVG